MGTDIHGLVERKIKGKWIAVNTLHNMPATLDRNYKRFALLAGMRGEGPKPKGFPEDASDTAKYMWESEGDHTPSWMMLEECLPIFVETMDTPQPHTGWSEEDAREYPSSYFFNVESDEINEHRFVFWFDS